VLQQDSERLEIREARLLHGGAPPPERRGETVSPLAVARMWAKEEREAIVRAARGPPRHEPLYEASLVRRVRGRVAHDEDERTRRVEPEDVQEVVVLGARPAPVEDVGLRPAGDDD